ncbi:YbaB/EbfC family nucleoid-associated protein [Nocardia sp. KC 131]|uniref:YbaB/EbfC family nucleoid-associated protein n=1 Tax=Nocardia arseniciresistens TaxID=3392119 RepID=UPI00398F1BF7
MANEHLKSQLADLLEGFQEQMGEITRIQQRTAAVVATGEAEQRRVTVCLNAEGTVIETRFADDIGDLDYEEIAAAVTAAAQAAKADLSRQLAEIHGPLLEQRARLPKLTDIVTDMPDLGGYTPVAPKVSAAPPGSVERRTEEDPGLTDAEQLDRRGGSGYKDSAW